MLLACSHPARVSRSEADKQREGQGGGYAVYTRLSVPALRVGGVCRRVDVTAVLVEVKEEGGL